MAIALRQAFAYLQGDPYFSEHFTAKVELEITLKSLGYGKYWEPAVVGIVWRWSVAWFSCYAYSYRGGYALWPTGPFHLLLDSTEELIIWEWTQYRSNNLRKNISVHLLWTQAIVSSVSLASWESRYSAVQTCHLLTVQCVLIEDLRHYHSRASVECCHLCFLLWTLKPTFF